MASNWPNKNTEGGNIKNMYDRLVKGSEPPREEPSANAIPHITNGQVNGIDVRQE